MKQFWPLLDDAETVDAARNLSAKGKFGDEIADIMRIRAKASISCQ
jgi:hypothetical protein